MNLVIMYLEMQCHIKKNTKKLYNNDDENTILYNEYMMKIV